MSGPHDLESFAAASPKRHRLLAEEELEESERALAEDDDAANLASIATVQREREAEQERHTPEGTTA
jgi:hypothetical protein